MLKLKRNLVHFMIVSYELCTHQSIDLSIIAPNPSHSDNQPDFYFLTRTRDPSSYDHPNGVK